MALRWYVVHAYSNFEHKVSASLKDRIKLHGLEDKFGEILVPTEEVVEMRDGQRRKSERKFFPGYVLVQMEMNEDTWHLVRETSKVLGFIGGTAEKPAPITEREANAIADVQQWRAQQDQSAVDAALAVVKSTANTDENLMSATLAAVTSRISSSVRGGVVGTFETRDSRYSGWPSVRWKSSASKISIAP